MAKEYSAKLTLQDNWNQVIDKAITKTSKLLKEAKKLNKMKVNPEVDIKTNKVLMKRVQDDLKKLEKSNINIKTKLDSSFKSTVNAIQRAVPNKKVVSIEAKENVTKTLNNVEREVFTKTNKVNNILKGSMKGMSSSINTSLSPLGRLINGLGRVRNVASDMSKATGSGLFGSALVGGVAGKVAGKNTRVESRNRTIRRRGNAFSFGNLVDPIRNFPFTKLGSILNKVTNGAMGAAVHDILSKTYSFKKKVNIPGVKITRLDTGYGAMIAGQKNAMKNKHGVDNYLPKMKVDLDNGYIARTKNKIQNVFDSISAKAKRTSNVISNALNMGFNRVKTSGLATKVSSAFSSISKSASKVGTRVSFAFQRASYKATSAILGIVKGASSATARITSIFSRMGAKFPAPVLLAMSRITSSIKKVAGKTFSFTIKAVDKATSIMKTIASKAAGIAKLGMGALLGAGTAGATVGISGMAAREKQLVSIEHFMDVADKKNNNGSNTMSSEQLNGNANKYMQDLINLANSTPFETQDIAAAGTRAIQMTNGSTDQAMDITKLATDMAALSPGKTTQDAMEALYDLRMTGEATRLQEFGLKVNKSQMNSLVGKDETDDLNEEEMAQAFQKLVDGPLKKTFSGGAEELSQTVAGKFSTVTGKLKSGFTDVAMVFNNRMSKSLDGVIGKIDSLFAKDFSGNFSNGFVNGVIGGINTAIEFVSKLGNSFKELYPKISTALEPIRGALGNVFGNINMDQVVGKITEILGKVIAFAQPILASFAGLFEKLAPKVMPVIDKILDAFVGLAPAFATVVDMITPVLDFFIDIFGKVAGFISEHSESINNVVEAIGSVWTVVWDLISGAVDAAWKFIEPILGWLMDKLGWVAEKITSVMDSVGKWDIGGKVSHMFSPSEWKMLGGDGYTNDKKADGSHATGLQYVPENGYKAILHRGEQVLTRQEADRYRSGEANNKSMNVTINVTGSDNPEKVAQVLYNKLMETTNNMA